MDWRENLPDREGVMAVEARTREKRCVPYGSGCLLILVLLLQVLVVTVSVSIGRHQERSSLDILCIQHTSKEPPMSLDLHISWHKIRFNGSLFKENVYRKGAGPVVDTAWEDLGINYRSIVVPRDQAALVGLRADQVKVNEKYGGGFVANVEGLHHLHCLDLLRQALYFNIDYYRDRGKGAFVNGEYIVQRHVSHCLDIIRQQLMCSIDVGIMGQFWFQPQNQDFPSAFVDFNTEHVCRNFDAVRSWAQAHQVPEEVPEDFLEPPSHGDMIYSILP